MKGGYLTSNYVIIEVYWKQLRTTTGLKVSQKGKYQAQQDLKSANFQWKKVGPNFLYWNKSGPIEPILCKKIEICPPS